MNPNTKSTVKKRVRISIAEETERKLQDQASQKNTTVSQLISEWVWEEAMGPDLMIVGGEESCTVELGVDTLWHLRVYAREHSVSEKKALTDLIMKQKVADPGIPGQLSFIPVPKKEAGDALYFNYRDTRKRARPASVKIITPGNPAELRILADGMPLRMIMGRSSVSDYICIPEKHVCSELPWPVDCFDNREWLENTGLDRETANTLAQILSVLYCHKKLFYCSV